MNTKQTADKSAKIDDRQASTSEGRQATIDDILASTFPDTHPHLAIKGPYGWGCSGHHYFEMEGDYVKAIEWFACGAIRYYRFRKSEVRVVVGAEMVEII